MNRTASPLGRSHRPPSHPFTLAVAGAIVGMLCAVAAPAGAAPAGPDTAPPSDASAVAAMPTHANGEHPAVRVARLARRADGSGIDANTFIVQPPASVRWTLGPQADPSVQVAAGAGSTAAGDRH